MFVLPTTITHANALKVRADGLQALKQNAGDRVIDGTELTTFDSTALSVLLSWVRIYPDTRIVNIPPKLVSLSKVYGLDGTLPIMTGIV